jgi:endo-1,3(4)-beta-glucanase
MKLTVNGLPRPDRSRRAPANRLAALLVTLTVAVGGAGCGGSTDNADASRDGSGGDVFTANEVQPLIDGVVHRTVKKLPTVRLADGLVPPTNRWFSGLVFGDEPQPVFPLPLSFGLTEDGFAFGLPAVTAGEKTIAGGFKPDVTVRTGAARSQISAYDDLTVTIASLDGSGAALGHTLIAQGSPYVRYTAQEQSTLTAAAEFTRNGSFWTTEINGVSYGLVTSDGSVNGRSVQLHQGGTAIWFAIPADGSADRLADLASAPVTGGALDYRLDGTQVQTSLNYAGTGDTAFAVMPHQQSGLDGSLVCDLGTFRSIYGNLKLCSGRELSYATPLSEPTSQLDLSRLSDDERAELASAVTKDAANLPAFPADTYFGGKALYRAAMIYRLASQLDLTESAAEVKAKLTEALAQWTDPQGCTKREAFCFVYDEDGRGMVGLTPSFGSDEYNDHHFHYGYFLYAAGLLAADDPELGKQYAPVMNLLAADIGSSSSNGSFPNRRVFDAYAGHSWASGTAPFADGNNQESSSEAVTAWTGLALWGKASGNAALERQAVWMLSTEAATGLAYWTNFDAGQPVYRGYTHRIVPLNWGGKRDYATWFSPEPAAMLGILVIPMSPASTYLAGDPGRINANTEEATGGQFDQKFGDYLLMYSALAGDQERKVALQKARELDDKWIDDGNSRSYLLAWLMSVSEG